MLYIFSGLPGTGKTTLSRYLSTAIAGCYLRVDTIEQQMKDQGSSKIYDQGYKLAAAIATDNLKLGLDVIADSTNPVEESRQLWHQAARKADAKFVDIEIICSDQTEHKKRVELRKSDIPNLTLPHWGSVVDREYHTWAINRLVLDTAGKSIQKSQQELLALLNVTLP